jgi:hypothetical protein
VQLKHNKDETEISYIQTEQELNESLPSLLDKEFKGEL